MEANKSEEAWVLELTKALKSVDIQKYLADLKILYWATKGIPYTVDRKNAPQGETINASRMVGSAIKKYIGLTGSKPYGMNIVGYSDLQTSTWRMRPHFRSALKASGLIGKRGDVISKSAGPKTYKDLETDLQAKVTWSLQDSSANREARLAKAAKKPKKLTITTVAYERNPDVAAQVLVNAKGKCEVCGKNAPFRRKSDNTPYLEVHHRKPLSEGGEDTVANAIALCPNCHRNMHYGI